MSTLYFDFVKGQQFTMEAATAEESENPANSAAECLYIICNTNHSPKSVYVGYAQDPKHRWSTRWEVFHCFGIASDYAKKVLCATCVPQITDDPFPDPSNVKQWTPLTKFNMMGKNNAEHLLISAFVGGNIETGITVTNTKLAKEKYSIYTSNMRINRVLLSFPPQFGWGAFFDLKP